jgi:hypothetical protein
MGSLTSSYWGMAVMEKCQAWSQIFLQFSLPSVSPGYSKRLLGSVPGSADRILNVWWVGSTTFRLELFQQSSSPSRWNKSHSCAIPFHELVVL